MHTFDLENIDHGYEAMINYVLVIPVSALNAFSSQTKPPMLISYHQFLFIFLD